MMHPSRRAFLRNSAALLAAVSVPARAQAQPTVAILLRGSRKDYSILIDGLLQGLREQGYETGRNVRVVEYSADGDVRKLHRVAGDVIGTNPAVVFAPGPWDVHALR